MKTPLFVPEPAACNILLVNGYLLTSNLLARFLDGHPCGYRVVGECQSGKEALKACQEMAPHLAILGPSLRDMPLSELISRLGELETGTRILVFSPRLHPDFIRSFIAAGMHGIVLKEDSLDLLSRAISTVLGGGLYFSPSLDMPLFKEGSGRASLTERERQALCLVAEGLSTKEVADQLGIAVKTAEKYRERVMSKLNLHDVVRLTHFAVRNGLVTV